MKKSAVTTIMALLLFIFAWIFSEALQITVLSFLFPGQSVYLHPRLSLASMTLDHLKLTLSATLLSVSAGFAIGTAVTSKGGKAFLPLALRTNALLQALPPSAVIILAFPLLGFGFQPTLLALFFYSLLPVAGNTILGYRSIAEEIRDAADGLGLNGIQRLYLIDFPMALPYILTGIRHAFILNLGTAAIGAIIGAGGLGSIIMSGLTLHNPALVFSGTVVISCLAFIGEAFFALIQDKQGSFQKNPS